MSVKKKSSAGPKRRSAPSAKRKRAFSVVGHKRRGFIPMSSIDQILKETQENKEGTGLSKEEATDKTDFGRLFQVFNLLRMKQQELTAQQLTVLAYIGHVNYLRPNEGLSMMAIKEDLNFKGHSSVQRVCQRLGEGFEYTSLKTGEAKRRDGLDFIMLKAHPRDPRMKSVYLTVEGRRFLAEVENLIKRNFLATH